jgi:hypothetical protein
MYFAAWTALNPNIPGIEIKLQPVTGLTKLTSFSRGFAGSSLGSNGYLTSTPLVESADLTDWYRFDKPGHYKFSVTIDWVWRLSATDTKEQLHLSSNEIEFDTVAADPAIEAQALASALNDFDTAKSDEAKRAAERTLDLMQSPAATNEKIRRFLATRRNEYLPFYNMLLPATDPERILPALQEAISNPSHDVPEGLIELTAELEVRKRLGDPTPAPKEAELNSQWQKEEDRRQALYRKLLTEFSRDLLKSTRARSGPDALNALFQVWLQLESASTEAETSTQVVQLREQLLNATQDLSGPQQLQFLVTEWDRLSHAQLLPIIERLAKRDDYTRDQAFEYWCKDWAVECHRAILHAALAKDSQLNLETILLLSEEEHPELDRLLTKRLEDQQLMGTDYGVRSTTALVLRVGSRALMPAVEQYLDAQRAELSPPDTVGYLLGYMFRVDSKRAARRLQQYLQNAHPEYFCSPLLASLARSEHAKSAVPTIAAAINRQDLAVAGAAALFLSMFGDSREEAMLLERLRAFRLEWSEKKSLLQPPQPLSGPLTAAVQFEQQIVSALVHSKNWTLTEVDKEFIANGCLTDSCREFASGRISIGF